MIGLGTRLANGSGNAWFRRGEGFVRVAGPFGGNGEPEGGAGLNWRNRRTRHQSEERHQHNRYAHAHDSLYTFSLSQFRLKRFRLLGLVRSHVELDESVSGVIASITVVDSQQLASERPDRLPVRVVVVYQAYKSRA